MKLPIAANNRITEVRALTGLRGVAALYVVFYHFFSPLSLTSKAFCLFGHGYLAVDIFFTLSGFVMALNYLGLFSSGLSGARIRLFLSRRLARVYPLYLVTLLLATGFVLLGLLKIDSPSLARTFVANLFTVQNWGNGESIETPAWSISAEVFAYLLFPLLVRGIFFRWPRIPILLASLSIAGLVWLSVHFTSPYDHQKILDLTHSYPSLVRCVTEFTLGMLAYRVKDTWFGSMVRTGAWVSPLLAIVIVALLMFRRTDLAIVLAMPIFVLSLAGERNLANRLLGSPVLEFLGLISFSVYLLHYLMVPLLNGLDASVRRRSYQHSHSWAAAIVLPLLLLCATATYRWFEVPARKAMRVAFEGGAVTR